MKKQLFQTSTDWAPLVLRVLLGFVILAHGAQKLLGWFGGYGFQGTMDFFVETVGLPFIVGFLVILMESMGSVALILGLKTKLLGLAFTLLALGIMFSSHIQNGFFMNWFGNQEGEGFEFFILWIAISASLMVTGGGKYSLDQEFQVNS